METMKGRIEWATVTCIAYSNWLVIRWW